MTYIFKLGHNVAEATKNNFCAKDEGTVDHSNQMVQEISLSKDLSNQAKLDNPKTVDSETMLPSIEVNTVSSTQRVSGELGISQSSEVCHLHNLGKGSRPANCLILLKYCKTFNSPK